MRTRTKPICIDVFSGVGGLSLGMHQAGFRMSGSFDLDPINIRTYKANFPDANTITADVTTLTGARVRSLLGLAHADGIQLVCGGSPCQGFSLIGKRQYTDPRNELLIHFARLITELSPAYFVIENVTGLLIGEARGFLARALKILRKSGYRWATPIRVLDAKDYGVPQSRRRVFVLGYRKDEHPVCYPTPRAKIVTVRDAIKDLYLIGNSGRVDGDSYAGKLGSPTAYSKKLRMPSRKTPLITGCKLCGHAPTTVQRFHATRQGTTELVSRFPRLSLGNVSPTLRAGTGKDRGSFTAARPIHPTQPRCITVREAARLHSFPDWFRFHQTQWHGFRQVGNSVPPLLARAIGKAVMSALSQKHNRKEKKR